MKNQISIKFKRLSIAIFFFLFMTFPVIGKDFIIVNDIESKTILCKIINVSNDVVSFSINGVDSLLYIKKDFVHKIKFGNETDTIILAKNTFKTIECTILLMDGESIQYRNLHSKKVNKLNLNNVVYIGFIRLDSILFNGYQKIIDNYTHEQFFDEYIEITTKEGNSRKIKIIDFDGNLMKIEYLVEYNNQKPGIILREKIQELTFSDINPIKFGLTDDKDYLISLFGKGMVTGTTIKLDSTKIEIKPTADISQNAITYRKNDLLTIENKADKKIVNRELDKVLKRISFDMGFSYYMSQNQKNEAYSLTNTTSGHVDKMKSGYAFKTSVFLYGKKGHGAGLNYSLLYSGARTEGITLNNSDTSGFIGDISEKNYSHFIGLSYSYISSVSILDNRNILRVSIGPGLLLNSFPADIKDEKGKTNSITIQNTTIGYNATIGYDILFKSYLGIGFEISYLLSKTNNLMVNGFPITLNDNQRYWDNRLSFTIGLRFY